MKSLKAICTATLLVLILSVPALAGEIGSPGAPSPSPAPPCSTDSSACPSDANPGEIGSPGLADLLLALASLI
jgi:hypothetical protein